MPAPMFRMLLTSAAVLAAALAGVAAAGEPDGEMARAAAFFKGRSVTLISGATPDGGDEQQERLFSGMRIVARHLGRHLPGAPSLSLVTLPGAGGRRAAHHIAERAARDGSVIGVLERGLAGAVSVNAYGWIGGWAPDTGLLVVRRDAGFHEPGELRERELVVGATAPQEDPARLARGLQDSLGLKLRIIGGYRSIGALHQAIERGEVSGYAAGHADEVQTALIAWLAAGDAFALMQLGPRALPWLPDAPLAAVLARDAAEAAALDRLLAPQRLGLPLVAPPGLPGGTLETLRAAFEAMAADDRFKREAAQANLPADTIGGAALEAMIRQIAAAQ